MINWFDMPAEGLSNGGLFEVKELDVTENGTYETKGEMYNKVTVNVEGGGSSWQTVFEGSVTTEDRGDVFAGYIDQDITADTIKVTFNGVEYTCNKIDQGDDNIYYGALREGDEGADFSEYPFGLCCFPGDGTDLYTQTAGTYTLKIEEPQSGGSSDYSTAEVGVEFIRDSGNQPQRPAVYIPCIFNEQEDYVIMCEPMAFPCVVPLYKGKALGTIKNSSGFLDGTTIVSVSATGNIQAYDNDVLIQGDGTITIHYTTS